MPGILHVELVEQGAGALLLRSWGDSPDRARTYSRPSAEIEDLIAAGEADYYGPMPVRLRDVGQRLFRWLDGGERWLSAEIEAAAYSVEVLVLAIAMPHGLAHLPWEVLHDGTAFLVHALNPPVLTVRWRRAAPAARPPANRPLQLLFMASSPENLWPVLDYEREEHAILTATRRWPLDLTVEESGCLEELGALVQDYGAGFFDVLHLTGHAGHAQDGTPVFLLEDSEGRAAATAAPDLARTLFHRQPLVFLSGCRTAQSVDHGGIRSLAEQLVAGGFRVVLGWGRPVQDADATHAAQHLYQQLSSGDSIALALVRTHVRLREDGVRDWHLLRLFCAGEPPEPLVTPLRSPGRRYTIARPAESEFLDPRTRAVRVATRAGFVGRRRLLQASLRNLREPDVPPIGLLLRGQGGRGKSSLAARLCDRLRREFQRVVVFGRLDETSLVNAWATELRDHDARRELRDPAAELRFRIEATLYRLADAGQPAPLFVLDDFEQNQPGAADGDLALAPHAASALLALCEALAHTGAGRLLVTCRYAMPAPFDAFLQAAEVPPLDPVEQQKQLLRLEQKAARATRDPQLLEKALGVADGNPRLFEWLHAVLAQPGLDHAAMLEELRHAEERFREDILARRLIASLPAKAGVLLGRMLLLNEPIPFAAVRVLAPDGNDPWLRGMLGRAADLGLLDVADEDREPHYRVPSQLGGTSPLLPVPGETEAVTLAAGLFEVLYPAWWAAAQAPDDPRGPKERRVQELIGLAETSGHREDLIRLADWLTTQWNGEHRARDVKVLLDRVIGAAAHHHRLLLNLARAERHLGDGDRTGRLLREALDQCPPTEERDRSDILSYFGEWLVDTGHLDEGLRVLRDEVLPIDARRDDSLSRAVTLAQIADALVVRGEPDEALRVLREEVLPIWERSGDAGNRAGTLASIADLLASRGEWDEAIRILRGEVLPVYDALDDAPGRAATLASITSLLALRGEVDEALRILREDVLPVYDRMGDARSRVATLAMIASMLAMQGELDEALRILRDDALPLVERYREARLQGMVLGRIVDLLMARVELDEVLRISREEMLPLFDRLGDLQGRAMALGKIADVLSARGELVEALRILRDEMLPVHDRLGDVHARAITFGKIADVLSMRGEVDEALRIRREEQLPVFERLGDVRLRVMVLSQIADVLAARGELDEAMRIRREEQLPVLESVGDVRFQAVTWLQIADLLFLRDELDEALRLLRKAVAVFEASGDQRERAVAMGKIALILAERGEIEEALRIRRNELQVYEQLGDARSVVIGKVNVAMLLFDRQHEGDVGEITQLLTSAYRAAVQHGYAEAAAVAELLEKLGIPLPAGT